MPASLNQLWYVVGSGIHSQQRHLEAISHNIANLNTIGFKASQAGFQAVIREVQLTEEEASLFETANPGDVIQEGMGVLLTHTTREFAQGAMTRTDDQLHLAISGRGFFQVTDEAGETLFTRAGDFTRDADGRLVNSLGYFLEPAVTIPEEAIDIFIDGQGQILGRESVEDAEGQAFGQIELATFANPDGLENVGSNAFRATEASGEAQLNEPGVGGRGALYSGFLEQSNVDMGREMTTLLRTQRAYSLNLQALRIADQIAQMANQMPR